VVVYSKTRKEKRNPLATKYADYPSFAVVHRPHAAKLFEEKSLKENKESSECWEALWTASSVVYVCRERGKTQDKKQQTVQMHKTYVCWYA